MKTDVEIEVNRRVKNILNEKLAQANLVVARVVFILAWLTLGFWGLFKAGILTANGRLEDYTLLSFAAIFLIVPYICLLLKGEGSCLKYILIILSVSYITMLNVMSGFRAEMLMILPVILTMRYYNSRFTILTAILTFVGIVISTAVNVYGHEFTGIINLNNIFLTQTEVITAKGYLYDEVIALKPDHMKLLINSILFNFVPNTLYLVGMTWIALRIIKKNLATLVSVDELSQKEADQKVALSEMQTRIMMSQIKPHFIYNSLSSIAALCTKDPNKARETTISFTRYLRSNMDSLSSTVPIEFEVELEHVKNYVSIEQMRFGDKIKTEINIEATEFRIPALTLQPIVENAIKHGLCQKKEGGTVKLDVKKENDNYVIVVADDGVGFNKDSYKKSDGSHIGIENVRARIEKLVNGTVTVNSVPGAGTTVTIIIPEGSKNK